MDGSNPYAPPQAAVHDVTSPDAALEPADRGTRLAAAILDGIIVGCMVYVPALLSLIFGSGQVMGGDASALAGGAAGLVTIAGVGAWCWLTIRYVSRNGQSIAKRILGIKVVRSDGTPASLARIFWLRNVVNGLLSIVPLYFIIDPLFIFGESRQCVHDRIADTIVINA